MIKNHLKQRRARWHLCFGQLAIEAVHHCCREIMHLSCTTSDLFSLQSLAAAAVMADSTTRALADSIKVHTDGCLLLPRAKCLSLPTMGFPCWYQGMGHHRILPSTHKCSICMFRNLLHHRLKFSLSPHRRRMVLRRNFCGFSEDCFPGSSNRSHLAIANAVTHPCIDSSSLRISLLVCPYVSLCVCPLIK